MPLKPLKEVWSKNRDLNFYQTNNKDFFEAFHKAPILFGKQLRWYWEDFTTTMQQIPHKFGGVPHGCVFIAPSTQIIRLYHYRPPDDKFIYVSFAVALGWPGWDFWLYAWIF